MHVLCVIPARIGSSRLPEKPLRLVAGQPLVARVVRRVLSFELGCPVVVATDDERVVELAGRLGVPALLTSPGLASGTERAAAVLEEPSYRHYRVVLNVQGDEPLIAREAVMGALERVLGWGDEIGTAGAPLDAASLADPNRVKVVADRQGRALDFVRRPGTRPVPPGARWWQHVGVYAYRAEALRRWVSLPAVPAERRERLEQLRPLACGMRIGVAVQRVPAAPAVDTMEDLVLVENRLRAMEEEGPLAARAAVQRGGRVA